MSTLSPVYWTQFVAIAMIGLGLVGFLIRRNSIVVLMCLELMLNGVNLLLIEASQRTSTVDGMMLVVFIITVAAGEVAVGLGILLNLYRIKKTADLDLYKELKG